MLSNQPKRRPRRIGVTSRFITERLETRWLFTTFYVDTNNLAASDNNAGTSITAPLKTIQQALNLSANNNATSVSDTILIRGGVYHEQPSIWTGNSGASVTDRTTISAYVNPATGQYEPVYIDAADPTTGTWIEDGTSHRWYLNNFTTQTAGVWVDWSPSNDGASLTQIGTYNAGFPDNRVITGSGTADMTPGTYYGDVADQRLYVWLADGSNPNLHTLEYANRARSIYQPGTAITGGYSYASHLDFIGLKLRHANVYDTAGENSGCAIYTVNDERLINCDIQWSTGAGVFLRGTSQLINCTCSNDGRNGALAYGDGFLISGGQYNDNYWRNYTDAGDAGIKVISNVPTQYGNIENAEIAFNNGKGIWFDTCFENTVVSQISGNYIHNNSDNGIDLEASRNFLVENNVIANNQLSGISLNAVSNAAIDNNTVVGNGGNAAIELDGGARSQGTVYPGLIATLNNSIENNIIANNFSDYDLDIPTEANGSADDDNNTSDHNLFYRRGGTLRFTDGGTYLGWQTTPATLSGWQSVSGQDTHSIVADPMFIASGTGGLAYELGSNSPAVHAGANLSAVVGDYVGAQRPAGLGYDLGAFQSTGTVVGTAGSTYTSSDSTVWFDDQLPDTATMTQPDQSGNVGENRFWQWEGSNVYSGAAALDSTLVAGAHRQYFTGATPRLVAANDTLSAYVWIDPANPPKEIMLEWQDASGSWAHQAYWGANLLSGGVDGSVAGKYIGALPTAGQWEALNVPASTVGLAGVTITGFSFDLYDGRALLDKVGNGPNAASVSTGSGTGSGTTTGSGSGTSTGSGTGTGTGSNTSSGTTTGSGSGTSTGGGTGTGTGSNNSSGTTTGTGTTPPVPPIVSTPGPGDTGTGTTAGTTSTPILTPAVIRSTLALDSITGLKVKGLIVLNITNSTDTTNSGKDTIALYASTDGSIDSSSTLLGSVQKTLTLKAGKSARASIAVKALSPPAGTYTVLAETIDESGAATAAFTGLTLTAADPFVALSAAVKAISPASVKAGASTTFELTITNDGNVASTGEASYDAAFSTDGTTEATPSVNWQRNLNIKQGGSHSMRIHVKVPDDEAAGAYLPIVSFVQGNQTVSAVGTSAFMITPSLARAA